MGVIKMLVRQSKSPPGVSGSHIMQYLTYCIYNGALNSAYKLAFTVLSRDSEVKDRLVLE